MIERCEIMNLRSDAKTLKDIAALFERDGGFTVLPSVLTSIADDILKVIKLEEEKIDQRRTRSDY